MNFKGLRDFIKFSGIISDCNGFLVILMVLRDFEGFHGI